MTPIERTARALWDHDHPEITDKLYGVLIKHITWNEARDIEKESYIEKACAVIESLREPSDVMIWAGESARKVARRGGVGGQTLQNSAEMHHAVENSIWRAMIDAILKESTND